MVFSKAVGIEQQRTFRQYVWEKREAGGKGEGYS